MLFAFLLKGWKSVFSPQAQSVIAREKILRCDYFLINHIVIIQKYYCFF